MNSQKCQNQFVCSNHCGKTSSFYRRKYALLVLITLIFMRLAPAAAAVKIDFSYTPLQNGGAENGVAGWVSNEAAAVEAICPEGNYCFQLGSAAKGESRLCSEPISVRRGETLQLMYSLKTNSGVKLEDDLAYAAVRSYGPDGKTILSQSRFPLKSTDGQWIKQTHELTANSDAYYVDVQFVTTISNTGILTTGEIFIDTISLFREINYTPLYADIKPLSENDTLYVFTKGPSAEDNQFVAMQTLQGIVARTDRPRLWIDAGDNTFVDDLETHYKIRFDRSMARDCAGLLETLKSYTSGTYVLYEMRDRPSVSAAATLAGLLDAVAVDTALEPTAVAKGYTKAIDVRGKDCRWVYENYRRQLQ